MPQLSTTSGLAPLVAHIVHRFDYGGLENGIVNVVNGLPRSRWRHAIIALEGSGSFGNRLSGDDVQVHECGKRPGHDVRAYRRVMSLLRQLRPAIVHTRNLGTIDCVPLAALAGVPIRIHGEHGWDTHDPEGTRRKYQYLRRAYGPLVSRFVTVSGELQEWLVSTVGIAGRKVQHICNGVDTGRFRPGDTLEARRLLPDGFGQGSVVVGSVTRFSEIKDPLNLAESFVLLQARASTSRVDLRLVMFGDGPLLEEARQCLAKAGLADRVWLPGSRDDIPGLLQAMDIFVLGSRREGVSNTVLEAMSSGLPVVASATGGNLEVMVDGETGQLVPPGDRQLLADAIERYAVDRSLRLTHGAAARRRVEERYSLTVMLEAYDRLYGELLDRNGARH